MGSPLRYHTISGKIPAQTMFVGERLCALPFDPYSRHLVKEHNMETGAVAVQIDSVIWIKRDAPPNRRQERKNRVLNRQVAEKDGEKEDLNRQDPKTPRKFLAGSIRELS